MMVAYLGKITIIVVKIIYVGHKNSFTFRHFTDVNAHFENKMLIKYSHSRSLIILYYYKY